MVFVVVGPGGSVVVVVEEGRVVVDDGSTSVVVVDVVVVVVVVVVVPVGVAGYAQVVAPGEGVAAGVVSPGRGFAPAAPAPASSATTRPALATARAAASSASHQSAQELGDAEGEVERLPPVQPGVAGRRVAQRELLLEDVLRPAEALGDVVAGELDVDAARPGALGPVDARRSL